MSVHQDAATGRFLPRNNASPNGRRGNATERRQRDYDAFARDLTNINGQPLSFTEATLLQTAVEQLYLGRLKRTHAAERCTANGLRTIEKLMTARIATKGDAPLRMTGDAVREVAAIFNGGDA